MGVILPDSSAWIEFLRRTGSATNVSLRQLLASDQPATTDVVVMELLAGATSARKESQIRRLLNGCRMLAVQPDDYEQAAALYRRCRRGGDTVRKLTDCLIAAVAIRNDASVLHQDRDFDVLARHTALQLG